MPSGVAELRRAAASAVRPAGNHFDAVRSTGHHGGNGKQSIDAVTVTIGGKAPTHVAASGTIQAAIDAAKPGDLIIVDPTCTATAGPVACTTAGAVHSQAAHQEMLLMWKPVRLQGVGAASSIINANHPSRGQAGPVARKGRLPVRAGAQWSRRIRLDIRVAAVLAGLATTPLPTIRRSIALPLEAVVGWDATLNGNLAELLQEPSLMGALRRSGNYGAGEGRELPPPGTRISEPEVNWDGSRPAPRCSPDL